MLKGAIVERTSTPTLYADIPPFRTRVCYPAFAYVARAHDDLSWLGQIIS